MYVITVENRPEDATIDGNLLYVYPRRATSTTCVGSRVVKPRRGDRPVVIPLPAAPTTDARLGVQLDGPSGFDTPGPVPWVTANQTQLAGALGQRKSNPAGCPAGSRDDLRG